MAIKSAIFILSVLFIVGTAADGHIGTNGRRYSGSFDYPLGCKRPRCTYRARWRNLPGTANVEFEISARVDRGKWAAIGFSNNQLMPDTDAVTGFFPMFGDEIVVKDRYITSRNRFGVEVDESQDFVDYRGNHRNGMLTYTFVRPLNTGDPRDISLSNCVYFLYAWGGNAYGDRTLTVHTDKATSLNRVCISISILPQLPTQPPQYNTQPPVKQYSTQSPVIQYATQRTVPQYTTKYVPQTAAPRTQAPYKARAVAPAAYQNQYNSQYGSRAPAQYIGTQPPAAPRTQAPYTTRAVAPAAYANQYNFQYGSRAPAQYIVTQPPPAPRTQAPYTTRAVAPAAYQNQYNPQYGSRAPPQYIVNRPPASQYSQYQVNPRFQYPQQQPIPPFPTYSPDEAYEDEGVFRYPKHCVSGINCEYEAEWESFYLSEDIHFRIRAKVGRGYWAGIGFSDDKYMPGSDCITGHMQENANNFVLADRYLSGRTAESVTPDRYQDASPISYGHSNGILKFDFKRKRNTYDRLQDKNLYNCVYFLFAWGGRAHQGAQITAHTHKFVSKHRVCLGSVYGSVGAQVGTSYREPTYDFLRRPMPNHYDPCQRINCKWNQFCVRYGNHQAKCECRGSFRLVGTYCVPGPLRYY